MLITLCFIQVKILCAFKTCFRFPLFFNHFILFTYTVTIYHENTDFPQDVLFVFHIQRAEIKVFHPCPFNPEFFRINWSIPQLCPFIFFANATGNNGERLQRSPLFVELAAWWLRSLWIGMWSSVFNIEYSERIIFFRHFSLLLRDL